MHTNYKHCVHMQNMATYHSMGNRKKKKRTEALQRPGLTSTQYTEQPCFYAPDTALEYKNETQ